MHIIHLIERRYPNQKHRILVILLITSISALGIGLGMWILK
jgi:hypothetical protein